MLFKLKLIAGAVLLIGSFFAGVIVTKNHYQAKYSRQLQDAIKIADKTKAEDLKRTEKRLEREYKRRLKRNKTESEVRNAKLNTCPKLPSDYVRLYNKAIKPD